MKTEFKRINKDEFTPRASAFRLPNILNMRIIGKGFVLGLLKHNVWVKQRTFEFGAADLNKGLNKYLAKQIRRLNRLARENPKKFWKLAFFLLRNSTAFAFLALHKVVPNWYKETAFVKITKALMGLRSIRRSRSTDYVVREVEIPKDNGKVRTLSVPPLEWRLYLYLVNLMLICFLNYRLNERQYGHRPGGGVGKAWTDILKWYPRMANIFEFDFKAFHPSVPHNLLKKALRAHDVPLEVALWLLRLSNPTVKTAKGNSLKRNIGVPQGVATSAILGMVVLEFVGVYRIPGVEYIGFADDGVVGSEEANVDPGKKLEECLEGSGLELNLEKSGWIKKDGEELKAMKFLGCTWFGSKLTSASRSGNNSEMIMGGNSAK